VNIVTTMYVYNPCCVVCVLQSIPSGNVVLYIKKINVKRICWR